MTNLNDLDTAWNVPTTVMSHEESIRLRIQSLSNEELERQLQQCKADGHPYFSQRPEMVAQAPRQPFNWTAFTIGAMVVEVFVIVLLKISQVA